MGKRYAFVGLSVFAILFVLFLAVTSVARVEAGEACVVTRNGAATGTADPGLNLKPSVLGGLNCYNTRVITYESVDDIKNTISTAQHKDAKISGVSKEGLNYSITFNAKYHLPAENVEQVFLNYKTDEAVYNQVKDYTRATVPAILNTYPANTLYLGNLESLSQEVFDTIAPQLKEQGIILDYFKLKKPNFDESYEQAIEDKAIQVEKTNQKVLEQQLAEAEAERQRIQAEGDAAAQLVKSQQEADTAVIQANAAAEVTTIGAQADADKKEIAADAEAYRVETTGAAIEANPSVLQWEQIQAIRDAGAIYYLPSDGSVLPIMDVTPQQNVGEDDGK